MRVAVVGLGLIGGSVGLAAAGRGDEVVAFDPDPDAAAAGLETGAATSVADSLEGAVAGSDVAVVCGPVARLPELVARTLEATGAGCANKIETKNNKLLKSTNEVNKTGIKHKN